MSETCERGTTLYIAKNQSMASELKILQQPPEALLDGFAPGEKNSNLDEVHWTATVEVYPRTQAITSLFK